MRNICTTLFLLSFAPVCLAAQAIPDKDIPAEVKPFIERNTVAIAVHDIDLNGDGLADYLLVLEKKNAATDETMSGQRPLLLLIRQPGGALKLVKRNDRIVLCPRCGGAFGDPLESLTVGPKTFSVNHYGGSAWRWNNSYKFNYSRRDNTWQLVRVEEGSFNANDPEKTMKHKVFTPPKDFGKIDIADFDPENYRGRGAK